MHKIQHINDPSWVRDLIRVALAEKQSALLMHRLDCVLLITEGRSVQEVAHWFGVGERSVQRWVHAAYLSGIDGLIQQRHDGRPRCLSPEQENAICRDLMPRLAPVATRTFDGPENVSPCTYIGAFRSRSANEPVSESSPAAGVALLRHVEAVVSTPHTLAFFLSRRQ